MEKRGQWTSEAGPLDKAKIEQKKRSILPAIPTNFSNTFLIVCYPPKDEIQYAKCVCVFLKEESASNAKFNKLSR